MSALRKQASPTALPAVSGGAGDVVVCAEIFPDAEAVRRAFGDADVGDILKIIDREIDRANEDMPPHMRVRRIALRSAPFDKTTTKKIKRAQ
jgi:hypothetical protein